MWRFTLSDCLKWEANNNAHHQGIIFSKIVALWSNPESWFLYQNAMVTSKLIHHDHIYVTNDILSVHYWMIYLNYFAGKSNLKRAVISYALILERDVLLTNRCCIFTIWWLFCSTWKLFTSFFPNPNALKKSRSTFFFSPFYKASKNVMEVFKF